MNNPTKRYFFVSGAFRNTKMVKKKHDTQYKKECEKKDLNMPGIMKL